MSKLDELIEWHEKHATYYTDSAVLQQAHRDTAEALRLCRDYFKATERVRVARDAHCYPSVPTVHTLHELNQADIELDHTLAALRDAGLIERGG